MRMGKRVFWVKPSVDQFVALALVPLILVLLAALYIVIVPLQGRPFFFSARRMCGPKDTFVQLKIRTMQPVDRLLEQSVMGGDLRHRITPVGSFLRKTRLDELPQIFNVLRGDMVFIGPRPPLQKYVESNPDYAELLSNARPGITGLATVLLHTREERILGQCKNAVETDRIFRAHCIPLKIRIDKLYQRNKSTPLKLYILWRTVSGLSFLEATLGLCATIWNGVRRKSQTVFAGSCDLTDHLSRIVRLK